MIAAITPDVSSRLVIWLKVNCRQGPRGSFLPNSTAPLRVVTPHLTSHNPSPFACSSADSYLLHWGQFTVENARTIVGDDDRDRVITGPVNRRFDNDDRFIGAFCLQAFSMSSRGTGTRTDPFIRGSSLVLSS